MMFFKMIASCAGTGYLKGGGTFAAILYTILWWFIRLSVICTPVQQVVIFLLLTGLGVFVSNKLESVWGKDSSKIVIDEVAGMCCTLLFIPHQWQYALVGLLLFRFFDIVKPLFISKTEQLAGGWGVMADDVLAGIYACLLLQLIVVTKVF